MTGATVEEYIELLNAEQHVDIQKLRDYARHGVQPEVRGEVWLYLLGVLEDDKSQEMTSVRNKYLEYDAMPKEVPPALAKRIRAECSRYYSRKLARPSTEGILLRSAPRIATRRTEGGLSRVRSISPPSATDPNTSSGSSGHGLGGLSPARVVASRGPNRVSDGRLHGVGSLTGSGMGVDTNSNSTNRLGVSPTTDNQSSWVEQDPDALLAQELNSFGSCVENVLGAYLNRRARSTTGARVDAGREIPADTSSTSEDTSFGSADEKLDDVEGRGDRSDDKSRSSSLTPEPHRTSSRSASPAGGMSSTSARPAQTLPQPVISISDFHPALVHLCAPFVRCVRVEAGMYFAFERFMTMLETHHAQHPLFDRVATFLTLFRTTLPSLHAYFEEEDVDVLGFATSWLQHALAYEMSAADLARLWDTYFATPDPLDLHLYICIAILTNCQDALEELDQSETKGMLSGLPPLDVDRIINEAINIQRSHRQSVLEDDA